VSIFIYDLLLFYFYNVECLVNLGEYLTPRLADIIKHVRLVMAGISSLNAQKMPMKN